MLHFKYIKYRFTLKEKFLANETIHLRKHLRFITNKGFYHDFSGRATFENPLSHPTLNVLFWRIVDSGYPIIPHLFPTIHYHHPRDGRCHPKLEIERSTCAELIRSLIQSDREYQLRNARRMPWKKRGSFEILCEVISLLISPPPPPPAITIPFLFLVLSSSPARYFFLFSPSYRFIPRVNSGKEWREWNTFSLR